MFMNTFTTTEPKTTSFLYTNTLPNTSIERSYIPPHYILQFFFKFLDHMIGTTGWERAPVSSHGINALLSPSSRLPYKDTWMLTYDGRGSTQHCHWVRYTFLYQDLDTQLQTHIFPPYHGNQMSEENRWKLLTTAWRFPRTDQWLRESQLIKVLSPIILLPGKLHKQVQTPPQSTHAGACRSVRLFRHSLLQELVRCRTAAFG